MIVAGILACGFVSYWVLILTYTTSSGDYEYAGYPLPKEGIYWCEELQMELSCDPEGGENSYILLNGEKVICSFFVEFATNEIFVQYQKEGIFNRKYTETILRGFVIDIYDNIFQIKEYKTDKIYVFRIRE